MSRSITSLASVLFMLGIMATHARADLSFMLSDATINPGGIATVDVSVMSSTPYTLSDFSLGLQIMPDGTPTSFLQFSTGMSQPSAPFGNSNYVFAGQSFDQNTMTPFYSDPYATAYQGDSITGGDTDYTPQQGFGYVSIGTAGMTSTTFVAQVQFFAPAGATPGDEFQIMVLTTSPFTEFDDPGGNALSISSGPSTGGFVTVGAAVPEPSSLVITLTGLGGLLVVWCGRWVVSRGVVTPAS